MWMQMQIFRCLFFFCFLFCLDVARLIYRIFLMVLDNKLFDGFIPYAPPLKETRQSQGKIQIEHLEAVYICRFTVYRCVYNFW